MSASHPTPAELREAEGVRLPDVIAPGLSVLFCGINPGLWSAATGHHFAGPGNRFWPALFRSDFTPRLLEPAEQSLLPGFGLGITNVVERATAKAAELTAAELLDGGAALRAKLADHRPRWLAVLGLTAYRTAFGDRHARVARQSDPIEGVNVWVLPNPSGLNTHYRLGAIARELATLRTAASPPA